jgi:hypothetical protein
VRVVGCRLTANPGGEIRALRFQGIGKDTVHTNLIVCPRADNFQCHSLSIGNPHFR